MKARKVQGVKARNYIVVICVGERSGLNPRPRGTQVGSRFFRKTYHAKAWRSYPNDSDLKTLPRTKAIAAGLANDT
jgi:hypothetical protein